MKIITLTTDFGLKDGFTGVMKGVIASIAPQARVIDISHLIQAQNVLEGAQVLNRFFSYFPSGSIHVAVVDPGVGTQRRPLVANIGNQFFVGPDNGLCSLIHTNAQKLGIPSTFYHLDKPAYWLKEISNVFHGRDIFAPVAAHLANGVSLDELGTPISDPLIVSVPTPQQTSQGWVGEVIHIDHFGNIITNIQQEQLEKQARLSLHICGSTIQGLVNTFGERLPGELIALFGSSGNLVVSIVNGNAAGELKAHIGDPVEIQYIHREGAKPI